MLLKSFHIPMTLVFSLILSSCSSRPLGPSKAPGNISVMTYNVENLFDTLQDKDRDDHTYLPLKLKEDFPGHEDTCDKLGVPRYVDECKNLDWNEEILDLKMKRVANTILSVNGTGPDILLVQEVENDNALGILNRKYLAQAQYQTQVLIEGDDMRGIDVGVLSRLPLAGKPVLHRISFTPNPKDPKWEAPKTRGILEVPLKLPTGETLYVFSFHFPSQSNPTQERRDAIVSLNQILAAKGPGVLAIAGGDSNVSRKEEQATKLQRDLMGSHWKLAHEIGCEKCEGTTEYRGVWSFFDVLLFSPAFFEERSKFAPVPASVAIPVSGKYQLKVDGTPARFDSKSALGVSDHLPMYAEIAPK